MSWVKGDRLKLTIEVTAEEPYDEDINDIWFATSHGRAWIDADDIFEGGGTVSVEVLSKPVQLPTNKWAQVIVTNGFGAHECLNRDKDGLWRTVYGDVIPEIDVRKQFVGILSEGVDE